MNDKRELRRVLFIAPRMEARGTNEYVSLLAGELLRRDVEVSVFCASGPMLEVLEEKGVPVSIFKNLGAARFSSVLRAEFREKLLDFAPDIVHAPGIDALKSYFKVAGDYGAPVVLTMHSAPERARSFRTVAPRLAGIIATSQKARERIVNDFRFSKSNIVVISNGIDVESIRRDTTRPVFSGPVPVMGSVGPVERARGHELFVEAASILVRSGRVAHFVVAGEGGEISKLAGLGSELGLDKYLTFVRDFASYHEVLDALDVVIQSARVDVSGFSILDAMAAGRPVIAFNTGTVCEIIEDGKTGLIVGEDDAESLAQAMEKLAGNPDWGRGLGREAMIRVGEKFNIRNTAIEIVDFYKRILAGR